MYGNQIDRVLRKNIKTSHFFKGVYAADKFRYKLNEKNYFTIVNTAPSNSRGQHWILLYKKGNQKIVFDSLAQNIDSYCKCFKETAVCFVGDSEYYACPRRAIQDTASTLCGAYCIYVAIKLSEAADINTALKRFTSNTLENDAKICSWFRKYINKNPIEEAKKYSQTCERCLAWKR